jgi:hypothetical protein
MSKDRGVLLFDDKEPKIHGYLILGNDHYQIVGEKVSDIRTNLYVRKVVETEAPQQDMFDDHQASDKWRDLGPVRQAGMRCKEPVFWAYLSEEQGAPKIADEEAAAVFLRKLCGVASRAELGKPGHHNARVLWHQIDTAYQAWKAWQNA